MAADRFTIRPFSRFMLIFWVLAPITVIGIIVWAISSPYMALSSWGPAGLVGLAAWAIWEGVKLVRWFNFSVELTDEDIAVSGTRLRWGDIAAARARSAWEFGTFIELTTTDGRTFKIPACIQQNTFVLAKIEKHFPAIKKER